MKDNPRASGACTFILVGLGVIVALLGLLLAAGGIKLAGLGGSWYFLIGGLAMAIAGILIARRKKAGAWLYAAFLLGTLIWALADVGLQFWPLFSRLFMFGAIGMVVALVYPLLAGNRSRGAYGIAGVLAVVLVIAAGNMFVAHPSVAPTGKGPGLTPVEAGKEQKDWAHYGNTEGGSRFAALDQINRSNVDKLKVAWTYHTGDVAISDGNGAEDQLTPLQIGNKVFICTPHNNLIALDADTGKELWKNAINAQSKVWQRCRGMAYFDATAQIAQPTQPNSSPVTGGAVAAGANCQRRLLTNTIDGRLIAVDADTGEFCQGFGNNGQVNLMAGLGNVPDSYYQLSSAPLMAGTTVVVGGRVADNVQTDMPGGVLRGFDVITGEMRWAFDPGNPEDRKAPEGDATYVRSTPNSWAPMSYDPAMNTVFLPMGSSSTDIYGVERSKLDHTYGASVLALDATTGNQKWVYQTVHNDLWDFDLPMQPSLIDFTKDDGQSVPALVIGTKAGQIYVLDRATGKPLTQVDEVPVKPSNIPNEPYSPTQPKSVGMPQIGAQTLTESDMWGATPYDQLLCRIDFKKMRYDGLYTAPGTDLSLSFPGSLGGMNWGSISTDPVHGFIFVNDMRLGLWIQMIPSQNQGAAAGGGEALNTGMGAVPLKGTPYAVNKNRFLSVAGIPCQAPPFGTLTAIDMKTRQIAWQVPVGTVEDTGPLGIRMHLPIKVGLPTLGGTLSTQGGLVFIAGTQDFYLRAYDSSNGSEVWKARLPVGSQGGPMTYVSPKTGKQYVVITAGGARQSTDRGDYVISYALP